MRSYFGSGGILDFKTGELIKPPSLANDKVKPTSPVGENRRSWIESEIDGWRRAKAASPARPDTLSI
jgi:hypothetical protein